jgi:hypothetical protein
VRDKRPADFSGVVVGLATFCLAAQRQALPLVSILSAVRFVRSPFRFTRAWYSLQSSPRVSVKSKSPGKLLRAQVSMKASVAEVAALPSRALAWTLHSSWIEGGEVSQDQLARHDFTKCDNFSKEQEYDHAGFNTQKG